MKLCTKQRKIPLGDAKQGESGISYRPEIYKTDTNYASLCP